LLGMPVWLKHAPAILLRVLAYVRAFPGRTAMCFALGAAMIALLTVTFANPHPWNRDLFWDGCTFTLLRNWPLDVMDRYLVVRAASALNVVLMFATLIAFVRHQSHRRELWLALAAGAALPLTNNLVEPRYFIPGAAFVLLFLEIDRIDARWLAIWWAMLCALHAPFVAAGLSLW
jgi:hypothetical protein